MAVDLGRSHPSSGVKQCPRFSPPVETARLTQAPHASFCFMQIFFLVLLLFSALSCLCFPVRSPTGKEPQVRARRLARSRAERRQEARQTVGQCQSRARACNPAAKSIRLAGTTRPLGERAPFYTGGGGGWYRKWLPSRSRCLARRGVRAREVVCSPPPSAPPPPPAATVTATERHRTCLGASFRSFCSLPLCADRRLPGYVFCCRARVVEWKCPWYSNTAKWGGILPLAAVRWWCGGFSSGDRRQQR